MALPVRGAFRPRYVLASELALYGLPDSSTESSILSLVDAASSFIDQYCGRTDGNGISEICLGLFVACWRQWLHCGAGIEGRA